MKRRGARLALLAIKILLVAVGVVFVARSITWNPFVETRGRLVVGGVVLHEGPGPGRVAIDRDDRGVLTARGPAGEIVEIPDALLADRASGLTLRPGIGEKLYDASLGPLALALGACALTIPVQALRWWLLMRRRGVPTGFAEALRLFMVGLFFNIVLPGTTGGDAVRAYAAAKTPGFRAVALASVVVDRGVGIFALVLLGAIAGLWAVGDAGVRPALLATWGVLVLGVVCGAAYLSPGVRRVLRVESILARLPGGDVLRKLDDAVRGYARFPGALALSAVLALVTHGLIVLAAYWSSAAIGSTIGLGSLLTVLPLVLLVGSLPLSFLGFGVMEPTGIVLFQGLGVTANTIVTVLVLIRLEQVVFWLLGGGVLLLGRGKTPAPADQQPAK